MDTWIECGLWLRSGISAFICSRISGLDCPWVTLSESSQDLMVSLLRSPDTIPTAHPNGSKMTSHGVNRVKFNCNLGQEKETENHTACHPDYCGCMYEFTLCSTELSSTYSGQLFRLNRFSGWFIGFLGAVGRAAWRNERNFLCGSAHPRAFSKCDFVTGRTQERSQLVLYFLDGLSNLPIAPQGSQRCLKFAFDHFRIRNC